MSRTIRPLFLIVLSIDHEPLSSGQAHVDMNVIEDRYSSLAPYYFEWQTIYESAFEQQACHLGGGTEVFPEVRERVAWETEGLLIACWLAPQDDVEEIEYRPSGICRLERSNIKKELRRFLADIRSSAGEPQA